MEIANRLAEIRRQADMGARPFAELVAGAGYAVSYASVLAYEAEGGTEKVPAAYCMAVARAFGLSIGYVLGLSDDPVPVEASEAQKALLRIEREIRRARKAGALDKTNLTPARSRSASKSEG